MITKISIPGEFMNVDSAFSYLENRVEILTLAPYYFKTKLNLP
jgi:hypothetical protein